MNRFKLQIMGALGTLIVATVITLIVISNNAFRSESVQLNKALLRSENAQIESELLERFAAYRRTLSSVQVLASDVTARGLSSRIISQLQTVHNIQEEITTGIYLFRRNGELYNMNGKKLGSNVRDLSRQYYNAIFNQGRTFFVSEPYTSSTTGKKVVGAAYQLSQDVAILSSIRFDAVLGSVADKKAMFMYTTDGTIIAAPYKDFIGKNIFQERPPFKNFNAQHPQQSYSITLDGKETDFTTFWTQLDNGWSFVTYATDDAIEKGAMDSLYSSLLVAFICLIIVSFILLFIVNKLIIKPVGGAPEEIAALMKEMATGDLTQNLQQSGNETGIYLSLINLSNQLSQLIKTSHDISGSVSSASTELTSVMENTMKNSEDELKQVEQISTAINELSSTSMEVSDKAVLAEEETRKAQSNVEKGKQTLEKNISLTIALTALCLRRPILSIHCANMR